MKAEDFKGIIGCEESQAVTLAFRERGFNFFSNDIKDCSGGRPEYHIKDDFFHHVPVRIHTINFLGVHPVCKFMAYSGVLHLSRKKPTPGFEWSEKYQRYINWERYKNMEKAAIFLKSALACVKSVGVGYIEQPVLHKYAMEIIGERPTQIIHPWQFGHTTKKRTYLWVVGLPKLVPTDIIPLEKRTDEIHTKMGNVPERAVFRSKTFPGIAKAMAQQWGNHLLNTLTP
jgi:hypothetical protein